MKSRWVLLALLFGVLSWGSMGHLKAQSANLQGFGGTFGQPYRSGDLVVIYGTNLFSNQSPCDSLLLYTGGMVLDTVKYSEGASVDTPLKFVRAGTSGGVDTVKFRLHKNVACSPSTFVRYRKQQGCGLSFQNSNMLFMATGERALVSYGGTDSTYCVGDANVAPLELQDNVFFSYLSAPGFLSTGNPNNIDSLTGQMLVSSSDTGYYYIVVYTDTLAPGHPDCNDADTVLVKILAMSTEAISYGVDSMCPSISTPQGMLFPPSIAGGLYSAVPATGLVIDSLTGEITASASTPATYQVTYTHPHAACSYPSVTTIYIDTLNQTSFDFPKGICQGDTLSVPFLTQYTPGTYTVSALSGFSGSVTIDPTTGELTSGLTTFGPVQVIFTPTDQCRVITRDTVTILKRPTADFSVGVNGVICLSTAGASVPLVPVSPSATAIWSAPGLTLGVNSIIIDVNTPTGGPFYVSYFKDSTYAGFAGITCEDSAVVPVMIYDAQSVVIKYPFSDSLYCDNDQLLTPIVSVGTLGGNFTGVLLSGSGNYLPNTSSGVIDLSNGSTNASVEVSYFPHAACPDSAIIDTVHITQNANLGLDFLGLTVSGFLRTCFPNDSIVTFVNTGTTTSTIIYDSVFAAGNGSPTATFPGAFSGMDLLLYNMSIGGPYPIVREVKYGGCVNRDTQYVEILPVASADFDYLDDVYCEGASNPVPHILGFGGGTFVCTNSAQFNQNLDSLTGEIDLSLFIPGTYVIEYNTQNISFCPDIAVDTVQFLSLDAAKFNYPGDEIIFCTTDTPSVVRPELNDTTSAGVWTITPATGLVLVYPDSGVIDISLSTPGTYIVEHAIGQLGGACNSIYSIEIKINQGDTMTSMDFPKSVYCQSEANPFPNIVGDDSTGFFYGQAGIQVNGQTGEINLIGSQPNSGLGSYVVTYRLQSVEGCVVELKDTLRIVSLDSTLFAYPKEFICVSSPLMSPSQLPNPAAGTFYMVSSAGDTVPYINSVNGDIDVSGATVDGSDRYEIFFYPADTSCRLVAKVDLNVYEGPSPNNVIISPDTSFCDLETVTFEKAGDGYLWFYVNGADVTNIAWGGQDADFFSSNDWQDGDSVTVISYSPTSDTLRDIARNPILNPDGGYYLDTSRTCWEEYTFLLTERPNPVLTFTVEPEVREELQNVQAELQTTVNQTNFTWQVVNLNNIDSNYVGAGIANYLLDSGMVYLFDENVPLQQSVSPGTIIITFLPEADGCFGVPLTDTLFINPADVPIFIPEVFTPDGEDDINDSWLIQWTEDIDPEDYEIIVYNRSGGEVEHLERLSSTWRGADVPDGVYWWVLIEVETRNVVRSGGLTIRRK